jgi:amino acid transporter
MENNSLNQGKEGVGALRKVDMKVSSIVFMLYCLVAAGAFGVEEMVPNGPGLTLIMLIVFPIIWALPISNLVAEASSLNPTEGGIYVWIRDAFGEFWGFQAGWYNTVAIYIGNSVFTSLAVDYASQYIPVLADSLVLRVVLKITIVLIFTIVNLLGIKEVGAVSTFLSVLILAAFLVVTVVGVLNWQHNPFDPIIAEGFTVSESISGTLALCIWMYCGYECISMLSGEVKNPQVVPKGLLIVMPLIAATYILPTIAGLASQGGYENWGTSGDSIGYSSVLSTFIGPAFGYIFLFFAIISQCAIFNSYLAAGSRGFFVLANDKLCPKFLVKVSKKRGVPYVGIISIAVVNAFLAQFEFTTLVMTTVLFTLALYILLPLAVIKLRKMFPIEERKKKGLYIMPGGKAGVWIFALPVIIIAGVSFVLNGTDYFLIGIIACSSGPIFYVICKLLYGGLKDDSRFPFNSRTRLAKGDFFRLSFFGIIGGVVSFLGSFVLAWYEGSWGEEYYLADGESKLFSDFYWMLDLLKYVGVGLVVVGIVLFVVGRKVERRG